MSLLKEAVVEIRVARGRFQSTLLSVYLDRSRGCMELQAAFMFKYQSLLIVRKPASPFKPDNFPSVAPSLIYFVIAP